jgi:glycosyltransferase involved in cell wall biosynthesis
MQTTGPEATRKPRTSIVIVTSDRCEDLRRCLRELRQHLDARDAPPAEVLTVHPPHDTQAMSMVRSEFPWVFVHQAPVRAIGVQRNVGARHARGEIVSYLDDDAWPRAGWLRALTDAFDDQDVVAASGPVYRGDGSLQCERLAASALARIVPLTEGAPLPTGMAPTYSGCNLAIRRSALFACGGFDENVVYGPDDVDVCRRLFEFAGRNAAAFAYRQRIAVNHESSPGPFRRTLQDRAWYTVARDTVYFGIRYAGPARGLLAGAALQVPKFVRFGAWLLTRRLGPVAFARCVLKLLAGTLAGCAKGLSRPAALPLRPLANEPAAPPPTVAATPARAPAQPV